MKTYSIYHIKDPKVMEARKYLAHSLKYLCEINGRKKSERVSHSDPFMYYNSYIVSFNKLTKKYAENPLDRSPDEFYKAIANKEFDLCEVVREFLIAVAAYLMNEKGHDVKVVFLPFYFNESYERHYFLDDAHKHYFDYVRDKLIGEYKYSIGELKDMLIEAESLKMEFNAFEEVHVSDFYDDDNNGYQYGLQIGAFERDRTSIDIEPQWFKTEKKRDKYIKKLEKDGFIPLDEIPDSQQIAHMG